MTTSVRKPPSHVEQARAAAHRAWAAEVRTAFLEDVEWLVQDGVTLDGLSARLGMSANLIEVRLRNYGREDLLDRLTPNRERHGPRDLIDAAPAADRIRHLTREYGWTELDLARHVRSSRFTIQALKSGRRKSTRRVLADRILATTGPPPERLVRSGRDWAW